MKKLDKWVSHELTENQKDGKVSSSLILCNNKQFLNQIVMCYEKWILYDNQLSGRTEKTLQSTLQSQSCTQKRVMVTVW